MTFSKIVKLKLFLYFSQGWEIQTKNYMKVWLKKIFSWHRDWCVNENRILGFIGICKTKTLQKPYKSIICDLVEYNE